MKKIVPIDAILIPDNAKQVFSGVMYNVHQWEQEMFDGSLATFEMVHTTDIIKVLVVVEEKLVILHEEQPVIGKFIDIPGGRNDIAGQTNLEAAKREVLEETGMTFKNWKLINVRQPAQKIESFIYLYVASDMIDKVTPKLDEGEKNSLELITLEEYIQLGKTGKLRSWPTVPDSIQSIEELLALPEFKGKEIDR